MLMIIILIETNNSILEVLLKVKPPSHNGMTGKFHDCEK